MKARRIVRIVAIVVLAVVVALHFGFGWQGLTALLLTWALENLVKNSLDALGGKGGSIRIQARASSEKEVRVTVSDTGPGVSPEVRSELFEPGVTTKERGWGVGLALTRRIVEGVHKGRIELGEEGPKGAVFHIHLPAYSWKAGS